MPNVTVTTRNGELYVEAGASKTTAHLEKLISRQRARRKPRPQPKRVLSTVYFTFFRVIHMCMCVHVCMCIILFLFLRNIKKALSIKVIYWAKYLAMRVRNYYKFLSKKHKMFGSQYNTAHEVIELDKLNKKVL